MRSAGGGGAAGESRLAVDARPAGALALASLVSIAVSIIPLLVALYLMSKKLRAAIKGGEPAPEVGVPWVKHARGARCSYRPPFSFRSWRTSLSR